MHIWESSAHLGEVYGASVSKATISTITDRVLDGMVEWQNRPLDPVYPVVFVDCVNVKADLPRPGRHCRRDPPRVHPKATGSSS
jgi:hypothetical protein